MDAFYYVVLCPIASFSSENFIATKGGMQLQRYNFYCKKEKKVGNYLVLGELWDVALSSTFLSRR